MAAVKADFVERIPDEGQWFERGARADFFEVARSGNRRLEPATLGSYEVVRCARIQADGMSWLVVTLRPFGLL
jgi:hypothetical protein